MVCILYILVYEKGKNSIITNCILIFIDEEVHKLHYFHPVNLKSSMESLIVQLQSNDLKVKLAAIDLLSSKVTKGAFQFTDMQVSSQLHNKFLHHSPIY